MRMNKKLVVFDLDGTLNRTECHAVPAILDALNDYGITSFTEEDIKKTFGARDEDTIKLFFGNRSEEVNDIFWHKVTQYSENKYADCYKPYYGVVEVLARLKNMGYLTAICSNAELDYIHFVTKKLNIYEYFDYFQPLVEGKRKNDTLQMLLQKAKPNMAVMVGDRYFDMEAATYNQIPFVACSYGFAKEGELDGADAIIDEPIELIEFLRKWSE